MLLPLHLTLDHIGPVLLVMAAGAILWSALWYLLRATGFRAKDA